MVGPTAVGKTALSLRLAADYGCEIISGDSMQVYRGMDIGTAKATAEERSLIPHHMIDIHDPDHPFSVAEFQERAYRHIVDITERGKLPFLVGGTGLYVESLCYNFQFTDVGSDESFREEQRLYLERFGEEALHDKLREADPASADRLHPRDSRRVIRALEIAHLTGKPMSVHLAEQKRESPYDLCMVGLTTDRKILYNRIEERIDLMVEEGLVEEVRRLLADGYGRGLISMQALGYKEIMAFLEGETTLDAAVELLKRDTRRYAKRQLSWFRHMQDIRWVDVGKGSNFSEVLREIHAIIAGKFHLHAEYTTEQR